MKSDKSLVNKTQFKVTFTAEEVTAMLHKLIKEKHPDIPDDPSVWGFDTNYRSLAMASHGKMYQDIVFSWEVKHG